MNVFYKISRLDVFFRQINLEINYSKTQISIAVYSTL